MVPGFNTDFKYRGETYHAQTEDNGTANPVVVTLLYHKGAILASRKTSYRHLLGLAGFQEELKALMKAQHKDLMRELLAGAYDRGEALPAAPGGSGEDPAAAAAAVAGTLTPPEEAPPPPASAKAPRPSAPIPPPLVPRAPRIEPRRTPAPPSTPRAAAPEPLGSSPTPPATLDEQIMRYLKEFAATAAR